MKPTDIIKHAPEDLEELRVFVAARCRLFGVNNTARAFNMRLSELATFDTTSISPPVYRRLMLVAAELANDAAGRS